MKNLAARAGYALAFAFSLLVAACGGGGPGSSPLASDELSEPQTAPAARAAPGASCDYAHVWLTVTSLRFMDATQQWQDLALASPQRIDLLSASGGLLQALGVAPLQPGQYSQVRLVLAAQGNSVEPTGGVETALKVPSGASSGLKLSGDLTVPAGATADLALADFDACSAIVATGNGGYNLKPAVQARLAAASGPEVAGLPGEVLRIPGGGWVLAANNNGVWTMRPFDASGTATGTPSDIAAGNPLFTWFAALQGGGYAAVWIQNTATLGVVDVITQAWGPTGTALGAPRTIAQVDPGKLSHPPALPRIAPLSGGGYVIAWGLPPTDDGIYAQRFTASGAPAAAAVRVAESGTGSLGATGLAGGGYLVTWGRLGAASGGVQAFSATDVPLGAVQSAGSNGDGGGPPIPVTAALSGGGAVTAWQAVGQHVMMQQLAPDGSPVGAAQIVDDQSTTLVFANIAIGALPDGGSVIAWAENGQVFARRYSASGAPAGAQTKINLVTTSAGGPVGVAVHADGSFDVHWNAVGTDGVRQPWVRSFAAGSLAG